MTHGSTRLFCLIFKSAKLNAETRTQFWIFGAYVLSDLNKPKSLCGNRKPIFFYRLFDALTREESDNDSNSRYNRDVPKIGF